MKRKLISMLVLLVAAVTGAWADIIPTYDLKVGTNAQGTVKFYVAETEVTKAAEGATVTVAIEPNTGWSVGGLQGLWYAAIEAAKAPQRVQSNIDLLKDFELEPVTGNPNAFTFVMKRANAEISVSYRKLLTHTDISFEDIAAVTYTGQALTPDVTVKDGSTVLTKDTDFSVSYESNENVGTGKATIVGIGNYSGQVEKTFTINKADITPTAPTAMTQLTFNGQAQTLISAGSIAGPGRTDLCQGAAYSSQRRKLHRILQGGGRCQPQRRGASIHQRGHLQGCADQRAAAGIDPDLQPAGAVARDHQREGRRTGGARN